MAMYKRLLLFSIVLTLAVSCTNRRGRRALNPEPTSTSAPTTATELVISNVVIGAASNDPAQAGSGQTLSTLFFDTSQSNVRVSNFCSPAKTSGTTDPNDPTQIITQQATCACQYSWTEVNRTDPNAVGGIQVPRQIQSPVETVQDFLVSCQLPATYTAEIPDQTEVQITLIPTGGSAANLVVSPYTVTKGASGQAVDFRDSEGRGFVNIFRYSCYERVVRGMEVKNRIRIERREDNGNALQAISVFATSFCVQKGGQQPEGCRLPPPNTPSSQNAYYNLYVPSKSIGGIVGQNQLYTCPRVREPLKPATGPGGEGQYYPLDSSFALATTASPEFPIPVEAPSVLGIDNDPTTAPSSCLSNNNNSNTPRAGDPFGISSKCLGFARRPNADGSCPSFRDDQGQLHYTVRLRRFIVELPTLFDASGYLIKDSAGRTLPKAYQVMYVADRRVDTGNPNHIVTMAGPKACQYSYFDHSGTLELDPIPGNNDPVASQAIYNGGMPAYVATNASQVVDRDGDGFPEKNTWNGKNIDGTAFPNRDDLASNSCAATLPVMGYAGNDGSPRLIYLATTHRTNTAFNNNGQRLGPNVLTLGPGRSIALDKVYVRPQEDFAPHPVEDVEFQACVPESTEHIDPPLHFAKDADGQVAWCAETFPTQNANIDVLDRVHKETNLANPALPGFVKNYTSHVVKRSASNACSATTMDTSLFANYPDTTVLPNIFNSCSENNDQRRAAEHPNTLFIDKTRNPAGRVVNICADQTCDRTVVDDSGTSWKRYPLLAPPEDTEQMLVQDMSYRCNITFDSQGTKLGDSPSTGCCNPASVFLRSSPGTPGTPLDTAHFEPTASTQCGMPRY